MRYNIEYNMLDKIYKNIFIISNIYIYNMICKIKYMSYNIYNIENRIYNIWYKIKKINYIIYNK